MNDAELVLRNYRLRVKVRVRGEDTVVETEIRKVRAGKEVGKVGSMYRLSFGDLEIDVGEDLMKDIVELLALHASGGRSSEDDGRVLREKAEMDLDAC